MANEDVLAAIMVAGWGDDDDSKITTTDDPDGDPQTPSMADNAWTTMAAFAHYIIKALTIRKAPASDVTLTTSFADVMEVDIPADSLYRFDLQLVIDVDSASDLSVKITDSGNPFVRWQEAGTLLGASITTGVRAFSTSGATGQLVNITGLIEGNDGGTVTVECALGSTGAGTVYDNSTWAMERIS